MAMQARHHSHDFRPSSRGASLFLDEHGGFVSTTSPAGIVDYSPVVPSDLFPGSEPNFSYGFLPRKRARMVQAGVLLEDQDQRVVVPPAAPVTQGLVQVQLPTMAVRSVIMASGAASTSGREIDTLIGFESERMRAGLEAAWRRHAGALVSAVGRAATGLMRTADSELDRAVRRNAELEEKARQVRAEWQAWVGVATSHEAVAAGLRASLDQLLLLQPPAATAAGTGEGAAEDARSCCFEAPTAAAVSAACKCKWCGGGQACVVVLPCRHLCLCFACEAAVDACPVCAATKNGSLHVLVS